LILSVALAKAPPADPEAEAADLDATLEAEDAELAALAEAEEKDDLAESPPIPAWTVA